MNYIELLNQFWRLNEEHSFSTSEIALYTYLLSVCNRLCWKNPFNQSNGYITNAITMSEPTLIRTRNTLKNYGLIDFKSDKGRRNITSYTLKYLNHFSNNVSNSISINDSNIVSNDVSAALDNTKPKIEETKILISSIPGAPTEAVIQSPYHLPPVASSPPKGPTLEEVTRFFRGAGATEEMAEKFWRKWDASDWIDGHRRIVRWASLAGNFISNWEEKHKHGDTHKARTSDQPLRGSTVHAKKFGKL